MFSPASTNNFETPSTPMSPRAFADTIASRLNTAARRGDVVSFCAYVDSPEFIEHLAKAGPQFRRPLLKAYEVAAKKVVEPMLAPARPRMDWRVPGAIDRLRAAYDRGLDDEGAGRRLGISPGAARLARKRFLSASQAA